ncbi:lysophospholipid acyltransferase family protein [Pusillimonas sp. DMV24BSW_D]|uniref:lysophospholipid acyltransferase family protein n=1 Tax=Neopusillimonas aestuarii TaxID=2716226 RepID=UPI00140848D3|nr:lysophospholipid acyltransferase family protein [Pusillimonas sp. DMV24BSW_D]QIM48595.1 lysophospholipid acyltransferase family protein [Pusillimonas sp. DMV24BSW_D]
MTLSKSTLLRAVFEYFGRCPTRTRLRWGRILGWLTPRLMRSRAHIVRTNLRLCFPNLNDQEREALLHRHFYLLAQSIIDRGLIWFGDPDRVARTVKISGLEHFDALLQANRKILVLAPHFVGLDAAGSRLTMHSKRTATFYTPSSDHDVDALMREGRARFNESFLISRKDGIRGLIRLLRQGIPIYYLPDMDFGPKGAVFVPFFGVPAATLPSTAQIAQSWDAAVLPIISNLDLATGVYNVRILPPVPDFPGTDDLSAATARINRLIEDWVREDPAQYYWVHRRFKTRPNDGPKPY